MAVAQQFINKVRSVIEQQHASEQMSVLSKAKALVTDEIGDTLLIEAVEDLLGADGMRGIDVTDSDDKAIAAVVTATDFTTVAGVPEYVGVGMEAQAMQTAFISGGVGQINRQVLSGDCVFVFHAGVPDIVTWHAKCFGHATDQVMRGHIGLFDKQNQVFTFIIKFSARLFFNQKIFRTLFDDAADTFSVRSQIS